MEYMTSKETSALWGIGQGRILRLAREGRIEGAVRFGKSWLIPRGAVKPADGRTRQVRGRAKGDFFRFPLFVNDSADSFLPPLTKEEALLCKAQEDFFACRFEAAHQSFSALAEEAESIYVKICAITFMAVLSASYSVDINWRYYYTQLHLELAKDFPRNEEMKVFLPWLHCFCGLYGSVAENISFDPGYDYSPAAYYLNGFLSVFLLNTEHWAENNLPASLTQYEILCRLMEKNGRFLQAQELHRILFIASYMSHREETMLYHLRQVLTIAREHNLLFDAADMAPYYPEAFEKVLREFPEDFAMKVTQASEKIGENYAEFMQKYNMTALYSSLSKNDYQMILYILQGNSNRQISEIMHCSVQTISNKLSNIYDTLNISSRQELIEQIKSGITVAAPGEKEQ